MSLLQTRFFNVWVYLHADEAEEKLCLWKGGLDGLLGGMNIWIPGAIKWTKRETITIKPPLTCTLKCANFNWKYILNDSFIYVKSLIRAIHHIPLFSEIGKKQEIDRWKSQYQLFTHKHLHISCLHFCPRRLVILGRWIPFIKLPSHGAFGQPQTSHTHTRVCLLQADRTEGQWSGPSHARPVHHPPHLPWGKSFW